MQTKNKAIKALIGAGFEVFDFKKLEHSIFSVPTYKIRAGFSEPEPAEKKEPDLIFDKVIQGTREEIKRTPGETFDISRMVGASDWRQAFRAIQTVCVETVFNKGDFINVSFDVPAAVIKGVAFEELHIEGKVIVVTVKDGKVLFNFDDIIFRSPINNKNKNEGGFHASALAEYLNTTFLDAFGIADVLQSYVFGKISLLSAYELFGEGDDWEPSSDFFATPEQYEQFENEKNRVKSFENETHWYWTSSPSASSAASFCVCYTRGFSNYTIASSAGGVAPAFCVASATPI